MDRLQAMDVFVRVAEAGSFTAVADRLNVARSAITRQIAALEAHLGTKLLARSTRRLSLTASGSAYLEKCREILSMVEAAEGDLVGEKRAPRGPIRASVPMSFGIRHLMPLVSDFITTYPEVTVDLEFSDRRVNLIEEGMDFAVRISPRIDPSLVIRRLGVSSLAVVASPAYLDRHGRPSHPDDLLSHHCLTYTLAPVPGWNFRVNGEPYSVPVKGRLRMNNGDALVDGAIRGLGIVCEPTFNTAQAVQVGLLEQVLAEYTAMQLQIYAVFPGTRYVPHRVRTLVDYLAERIGPVPYWDQGFSGHRQE
ncbi:MAG TPA: LysR family transcriptional regulator [Aromatoleum sp.]|uniref:LysR family transcriptional regulator n=1 Tax=Aromatoleum sp. TaxID=2307007 RepID=UPI002B49E093|nr:LysR family transcriptional regulator [Aromatoleum sp.]HJV27298.1 LysR family transcriptional regulator [Aromatoleum sp.]